MHLPEGVLAGHTEIGTALVAVGALGYAAQRARRTARSIDPPRVALAAGAVFALQMCNVPVGGGTSGHLLGALLAAVLLGPWMGIIATSAVVGVQAALFADGGIAVMGSNIVNMVLVPILIGYPLYVWMRDRTGVLTTASSGLAAAASVIGAVLAFDLEYVIGGIGPKASSVVGPMLVGHLPVAVGEAVITAGVVALVALVRPARATSPEAIR